MEDLTLGRVYYTAGMLHRAFWVVSHLIVKGSPIGIRMIISTLEVKKLRCKEI